MGRRKACVNLSELLSLNGEEGRGRRKKDMTPSCTLIHTHRPLLHQTLHLNHVYGSVYVKGYVGNRSHDVLSCVVVVVS